MVVSLHLGGVRLTGCIENPMNTHIFQHTKRGELCECWAQIFCEDTRALVSNPYPSTFLTLASSRSRYLAF